MARILLDAGHREGIYAIGAGPRTRDVPAEALAGVERLTGIHEVFAEANVNLAGGRVCADWLPEYGYEATRDLLQHERPRALICLNDRLALGAYQALDDYALTVPTDVSVVSFDDHPIAAWIRPQLTTVALPHYDLGRKGVDVLFAEVERRSRGVEPDNRTYRVPMPVRVRESVAPLRSPIAAPCPEGLAVSVQRGAISCRRGLTPERRGPPCTPERRHR